MIPSDLPNEILLAPEQVKRPTESRLPSAENARQGLSQLLKEDQPRSYERAIVKGCYDGNAPYSQRKLNQDGQRWRCNLNFRGLEGTMDSARIPYYGLFSGVPQYATFKTSINSGPESSRWNDVIAEKFTCMLNRWRQFKFHIQRSQFEMLFEGWGPLIFDKDGDWRFKAIPARSFLVPQGVDACLDSRVPYFAVRDSYRVHELYDKINGNEAGASARGWNVEAVKNAIKFGTRGASGDVNTWASQPWEEWQKHYKDKTLMSSYTECDIIRCAHLYVMEYTGKVSHFIVTENSIPVGSDSSEADNWFLFKDVNKYESYDQVANVAFQNTGDGPWHSVKGIGLKSYGYEEVQNRLNCRIVDNANMASMILLQTGDAKSNQKMQMYVNGVVGMIPPGTTLQENRLGGDIQNVMGVTRMLENKLANKIGAFNQASISREDGRGEKPTATQVELAAAKEGSLSSSQIDNYFLDLDNLYSEVFRRAKDSNDPEAKRFVQGCLDNGVPREALDQMEYVRANRRSGYGSPAQRKLAMQSLAQWFPSLPEEGKRNALNEAISSEFGPDKIEVFNPPMDEPDSDNWMATQENITLHMHKMPEMISGMDHVVHLDIHLRDAEETLNPMREAMDAGEELDPAALQEAFEYAEVLSAHCEQHLAQLLPDPNRKDIAKVFEGMLDGVVAFHGKLRSALRAAKAKQAQQAREEQQAVALGVLDQAKLKSAEQSMAIQAAEAQQGMAIKQGKFVQQTQIKAGQAQTKKQLDTIQTAETIRLDRIKTAAEVEKKKKLNAVKPNGSKAK